MWLPRMLLWKKMWNPKWQPRNGCDGRLKAKILITSIQVNLCCLLHVSLRFGTKFTWIVVIKIFTFSLPLQPFLGRHFGFHFFKGKSIIVEQCKHTFFCAFAHIYEGLRIRNVFWNLSLACWVQDRHTLIQQSHVFHSYASAIKIINSTVPK